MANGFVDWEPWCTPIKDQGVCGSCVAFGCIGFIEPRIKLKANDINLLIDLSERDAFFCGGGRCGTGSWPEAILDQIKDPGICTEECCPYIPLDQQCGAGRCKSWWLTGKKILSWDAITDVRLMKEELDKGPLGGTMAVHQSFFNYTGGIYHSLGDNDPIKGYHMISIIGYDDVKQAWKLRNSWGTGWGEHGYCWIQYGDSEIDEVMYTAEPDGEIPPQPEPTPSPCPVGNWTAKISQKVHNFLPWLLGRRGRFEIRYINP